MVASDTKRVIFDESKLGVCSFGLTGTLCRLWNDSHSHLNTCHSLMKQDSLSK